MQKIPELLTIREAANLIKVHPNTLRNWDKAGRVQTVRIGTRGDRRFLKESLSKVFCR